MSRRNRAYDTFKRMIALRTRYFFIVMLSHRQYMGRMVFNHSAQSLEMWVRGNYCAMSSPALTCVHLPFSLTRIGMCFAWGKLLFPLCFNFYLLPSYPDILSPLCASGHWWATQVAKHMSDQDNQHNNGPHQDKIVDNPSALCLALWAKHRIQLMHPIGSLWREYDFLSLHLKNKFCQIYSV